jgi:type II secretory pathway pseudopilin PulG
MVIGLLKQLLTYQLKGTKLHQKNSGFTLIELLVGLILAFLIITPLLGFVVNLMDSDRREQAKATSEQEIQAALNYISRDLDQAVYIYDATGIAAIRTEILPALPADATGEPILVFWKRQFFPNLISVGGANCGSEPNRCDSGFAYSLVAYFLTQSTNCNTNIWSCTRQIRRFQIDDRVEDSAGNVVKQADPGFKPFFDLAVGTRGDTSLERKMNSWTRDANFTKQAEVLIDYIDQTPANRQLTVSCPPEPVSPDTDADGNPIQRWEAIPATNPNYSFYACVDSKRTTAKVFIRGNALARIRPKNNNPPDFVASQSVYFPRASILVKGRGLYNTQ